MKKKLLDYNFPEDLKKMSIEEMELLSYSIREFLIDKVSVNGGHLASNLGVVELTLALHRYFDSPKDKIIWDVGHQAYVHKILTGRAGEFDSLRKLDGLSGFPKAKESEHDIYDTGHSSVSISAAAGLAAARDLKGEKGEVIAVIGDGSFTGGMAYEALNNIGDSHSKVIVILNDNGMSISPNTGSMSKYLSNIRTSKGYLGAKNFVKNKIGRVPSVGETLANGLAIFKNDLKYAMMGNGILFEELGFTYFGPIDGHNLHELADTILRAKSLNEPVLVHVITKKGKGYKNAENNPGKFHGIAPFDKTTGALLSKSENKSFSSLFGEFMVEEGEKDPRVVAITAAMCDATGLSAFQKKFPDRLFDVGIAEEHAVSFAAGLAKGGMKPVVAIYSSFLQRSYDQIIQDVCMQNLPVVFALDRAGCVGADGETHHGIYDLSYLSSMPNMEVLTPKDANQLQSMLQYALKANKPVAIRYPRGTIVYDKYITSTYEGSNIRVAPQGKFDIWACGKMFECGQKVKELLEENGINAGLVDVTKIKPLDTAPLDEDNLPEYIITIEDNTIIGGFGHQMAAYLADKPVKVINFAWPDEFIPQGSVDQLLDRYGLTPEKITERIYEEIERETRRTSSGKGLFFF